MSGPENHQDVPATPLHTGEMKIPGVNSEKVEGILKQVGKTFKNVENAPWKLEK